MKDLIRKVLREHLLNESLNKISLQKAKDNNFFGPVYHATTEEKLSKINDEGFKVFIGSERSGDVTNGYFNINYYDGTPPPVHHLGYGIYFTTVKAIYKDYNRGSTKNITEYYLDVPNMESIGFGSPKTMMKWWVSNGYDPILAKKDRVAATINLTENLKSKYDAVHFRGKGMGGRLLDGDQIVVFDPDRIYKIDNSLSGDMEIGSTVITIEDKLNYNGDIVIPKGRKGVIVSRQLVVPKMTWAGDSKYAYDVRFKPGGLVNGLLDKHLAPYKKK